MSHLGVQSRLIEQTNCRVRVSKLGTLSKVQLGEQLAGFLHAVQTVPRSDHGETELSLSSQSQP